jgi:hypothetical protein
MRIRLKQREEYSSAAKRASSHVDYPRMDARKAYMAGCRDDEVMPLLCDGLRGVSNLKARAGNDCANCRDIIYVGQAYHAYW